MAVAPLADLASVAFVVLRQLTTPRKWGGRAGILPVARFADARWRRRRDWGRHLRLSLRAPAWPHGRPSASAEARIYKPSGVQ
jgi:hypothetical protein